MNPTCWSLADTGNLELAGDPDISELVRNKICGASSGTRCIGAYEEPDVVTFWRARCLALLMNQIFWSLSETGNLELVGAPEILELARNQIFGAS